MSTLTESINRLKLNTGELAIFWLSQNSFIIKTFEGTLFSIDPYLSRDKRHRYVHTGPPIRPEDFNVHYIFCTHNHLDHTDPIALPIIAEYAPETIFFGPKESCENLVRLGVPKDRVKVLQAGTSYNLREIRVTPYHSIPPEEADTTHFGYLFNIASVKVYNMGDTYQGILKTPGKILEPIIRESPDIAMFPIIGDTPERKPEDAFFLAKRIKPKIVIPCHYDCFKDRTVDPKEFVLLFKDTVNIKPIIIQYKGMFLYRTEDFA